MRNKNKYVDSFGSRISDEGTNAGTFDDLTFLGLKTKNINNK